MVIIVVALNAAGTRSLSFGYKTARADNQGGDHAIETWVVSYSGLTRKLRNTHAISRCEITDMSKFLARPFQDIVINPCLSYLILWLYRIGD